MAEDGLKEFLRQQARGLDSLLELTPAKHMFGEDNSDQWQRKKQTPEQKKAARLAKLDPANWKSAKDVYDERSAEGAKKRKREDAQDEPKSDAQNNSKYPSHKKQKQTTEKPALKVKSDQKIAEVDDQNVQNVNLKKRTKKRIARVERNARVRERKEAAKARKAAEREAKATSDDADANTPKKQQKQEKKQAKKQQDTKKRSSQPNKPNDVIIQPKNGVTVNEQENSASENEEDDGESGSSEDDEQDVSEIAAEESNFDKEMSNDGFSATSSEGIEDNILSPVHDSASSSVSSIQPPLQTTKTLTEDKNNAISTQQSQNPSAQPLQSDADRQAARVRLQSQISQFRSQRKADDKPIRSRAELLEERRRKEAERKAAKKEQRRKEKEEESRRQDEEIARRFSPGGSGSGSLLGSPRSPMIDEYEGKNAFTFSRIAFADGSSFDPSTNSAADPKKRKGPSDAASALRAAENKQSRIAGLDDAKKADIAEKDMWLNARKRAHGEKVRDDTSLLKKALKRQEKSKGKSEKEWEKRTDGVKSAQEAKQKKRTENLKKRSEEKGSKKGKKVKRPGFEGSFRGRTGKSKK